MSAKKRRVSFRVSTHGKMRISAQLPSAPLHTGAQGYARRRQTTQSNENIIDDILPRGLITRGDKTPPAPIPLPSRRPLSLLPGGMRRAGLNLIPGRVIPVSLVLSYPGSRNAAHYTRGDRKILLRHPQRLFTRNFFSFRPVGPSTIASYFTATC